MSVDTFEQGEYSPNVTPRSSSISRRWPNEAAQVLLPQDVFAIGNLDGKELR
jgi:hypothetical protein